MSRSDVNGFRVPSINALMILRDARAQFHYHVANLFLRVRCYGAPDTKRGTRRTGANSSLHSAAESWHFSTVIVVANMKSRTITT